MHMRIAGITSAQPVSVYDLGRITIPKRLRQWKKIEKGDEVIVGVKDGMIVVVPMRELVEDDER